VTPRETPSRAAAVLVTAIALALINVAVAWLIVAAIGPTLSFGPTWLAALLLLLGVVVGLGAVYFWREYLLAHKHQ
jgi:hypothetical protein